MNFINNVAIIFQVGAFLSCLRLCSICLLFSCFKICNSLCEPLSGWKSGQLISDTINANLWHAIWWWATDLDVLEKGWSSFCAPERHVVVEFKTWVNQSRRKAEKLECTVILKLIGEWANKTEPSKITNTFLWFV